MDKRIKDAEAVIFIGGISSQNAWDGAQSAGTADVLFGDYNPAGRPVAGCNRYFHRKFINTYF
jgi:hypothetical protein